MPSPPPDADAPGPTGPPTGSATGDDVPQLPRVTPYLLRRADDLCARRLASDISGAQGSDDAVNRAHLRSAFLDAAHTAHADGGRPRPAPWAPLPGLEPEERAVFEQAVGWYLQLFGDRPGHLVDHECDRPTESARRGVRIGGWVDLAFVGADGRHELRQFDFWGGRTPADPLDVEGVRIAVLRLSRWFGDEPLDVTWADLVTGATATRTVVAATDLPPLVEHFDARLAVVRDRVRDPVATPGEDCGACRYVRGCPAHPPAPHVRGKRGDFRPAVLRLNPTAIERWFRCHREWSNRLLDLPSSDAVSSGDHGLRLHAVLKWLHEHGDCAEEAHRQEAVVAHGGDDRLAAELRHHASRCPTGATAFGHEHDLARFRSRPYPPFMATARIDAIWIHDGVLDARDYKSGTIATERVAEDPRAWVQAWVLAPVAERLGLRLRLRYEHLAAEVVEDPDPWDLDDDDLYVIESKLAGVVTAMWSDQARVGIADADVCQRCRYRSICPQSATPAVPVWPRVDDADLPPEEIEP